MGGPQGGWETTDTTITDRVHNSLLNKDWSSVYKKTEGDLMNMMKTKEEINQRPNR